MKLISLRSGHVMALSVLTSLMLGACSGTLFQTDTVDYRSARQAPRLELPPDYTKLEPNQNYQIPGSVVDYESYISQTQEPSAIVRGFTNTVGNIEMKRDGDKRWLVVEGKTPEEIWSSLEAFWQDSGFALVVDEPSLGILETDWAENRANIPQDFIRRGLGKIFDSLYSTGERDKFRTRIEVTDLGTEVFITHRGVEEVYSDREQVTTVWQPRASNPDLEAEMLRRLMMRLGATEEQSKAAVEQPQQTQGRTQLLMVDGHPELILHENFEEAWRWVGISLDRLSFTVIDRDLASGIYNVRYVDPVVDTVANEPGLLKRIFGGKPALNPANDYQVKVASSNNGTLITLLDKDGGAVDVNVARRILELLEKDLR